MNILKVRTKVFVLKFMKSEYSVPEVVGIFKAFDVLNVHVVVEGDEVGLVVHVQHARLDVLV